VAHGFFISLGILASTFPMLIAWAGQTSWQQKQVMQASSLMRICCRPLRVFSNSRAEAGHILTQAEQPMHLTGWNMGLSAMIFLMKGRAKAGMAMMAAEGGPP